MKDKILLIVAFFGLAILAYFSIFHHLGVPPIVMWDESIYANNAIEMYFNGNFLVKYYDGKPEMWATEPPLMCWLSVVFLKIIGLNETAIRLPSALSAIVIIIGYLVFFKRYFNNWSIGIISALLLMSDTAFIGNHIVRTGDLDALLSMFLFFSFIHFFKYINQEDKNNKNLLYSTIFIILAVYTKSVAGLFFLPAFFIYTLYRKKLKFVFTSKMLYYSIGLFLLIVGLYYILREYQTPGYLNSAWNNEIASRYTKVSDGHSGPFLFYINLFFNGYFTPWIFILPLSLLVIFFTRENIRSYLIYSWFIMVIFLLIISFSKTKMYWYAAPFYPIAFTCVAIILYCFLELFISIYIIKQNMIRYKTIILSAVILYIIGPFIYKQIEKNMTHDKIFCEDNYKYAIESLKKSNPEIKKITILVPGWYSTSIFYQIIYNKTQGYNIKFQLINEEIVLETDKNYIYWHPAVTEKLNQFYKYQILDHVRYKTNGEIISYYTVKVLQL